MLNATPTISISKEREGKNLNQFLRDVMCPEDQLDLGLINRATYEQMVNNPIINVPTNQQLVDELSTPKAYLNAISQDASDRGVEYAGCLTKEETVTDEELQRALDLDDFTNIKEQTAPETKRSNFRYIDKQRNEQDGYTRYLLANGNDRIIYDDELINNPRLKQKVELSNAREEGDREAYNKVKEEQQAKRFETFIHVESADTDVQCFLKVGSQLYGDAINLPPLLVRKLREKRQDSQRQLISYLDMFKSPIKSLIKLGTKIKVVDQCLKTLTVLQ